MTSAPVNLDHLSATPLRPSILEEMRRLSSTDFQSAWSQHTGGNAARISLQFAREQFAQMTGADDSYEVIFTSTGSEAHNLVIKGRAFSFHGKSGQILYTATDHPSIIESVKFLERQGVSVRKMPVDSRGLVDPEQWRAALGQETILACTHLANHDLGTIQPIKELVQIAHAAGVPVLIDATYAGAWVPFCLSDCPADFFTLSPHRFYGPKGVGVLIKKRSEKITPLIHGGLQENELRAGHENIPAIYGAALAAQFVRDNPLPLTARPAELQKLFLEQIAPVTHVRVNGPDPAARDLHVGNFLSLSVEFVESEELVLVCDRFGLRIAGASGCVSRRGNISHTLIEIGVPEELARGTVLISFGVTSTPEEVMRGAQIFIESVARLREMSPRWHDFQAGRVRSAIA